MPERHRPWPYPRTTGQVIQAVMVSLAIILAGLVVTAAWAEHYRNKMLDADALQQAASSLSGYASEGAAEVGQAKSGRSTQHYQRTYLQELADETQQVTDFVQAHSAPAKMAEQRHGLLRYGAQLHDKLAQSASISQSAQLTQFQHDLTVLRDTLTQLEQTQ